MFTPPSISLHRPGFFGSVDAGFSPQSDQEAVLIHANDPYLLPGTTTTGSSHATEPGEEGLGVGSEWGGGHRHSHHPAVQPIPPYLIRLNHIPSFPFLHPRIHVPVPKAVTQT